MFFSSLADLFVVVVIAEFGLDFIFLGFGSVDGCCEITTVLAACFLGCLVRVPLAAQAVVDDVEAGTLEESCNLFDSFTAPAIAAESSGFLILEFQAADHFHDAADGEEEAIVDGRRADEDGFRFEDFRNDVVLVIDSGVKKFHCQRRIRFAQAFGDAFSHAARGIPHRIVNDGDLVFLVSFGPILIFGDDFQGIFAPDDTVARANHVDRDTHLEDFIDFPRNHGAVEVEDIGIVFHGFLIEFCLVYAVIVHSFAGIVLTETVVAEEDVFAGHISEHRIRPMEHSGFDEDELAVAQVQGIAGLDVDEVPILVIEAAQDGFPFLGAVNRRIRDFPHQCRQSAAVVVFIVVHDDIVDVFEVDFLLQVSDEFVVKGFPDRIHEDRLFIADQVGVVRRALFCRIFMAVEFVQFPVDFTYPSHFFCNFFTHDDRLLFSYLYMIKLF